MPPTASRSTHGCGRRVRQKGRAGARKQLSSSSDSNEKRLDRRLILEEEKLHMKTGWKGADKNSKKNKLKSWIFRIERTPFVH